MQYPIGTRFTPLGKFQTENTVTDILKTYNSKGDLVRVRYVATHTFMGQTVTHHDIAPATIARGSPILSLSR